MAPKKRHRLEKTIAAINRRWGSDTLRPLAETPEPGAAIATGFPALDKLLPGGGIPRGTLTELAGAPTSGRVTIGLKIAEQAQLAGEPVVWADLSSTFDPDYAARCGVDLSRLLLAWPRSGDEGLDIAAGVLAKRAAGLVVLDVLAGVAFGRAAANRLGRAVTRTSGAALLLLPPEVHLPVAALRLDITRERWLDRGTDVRGYRATVELCKSKWGGAGKRAVVAIVFNGTVRGDST